MFFTDVVGHQDVKDFLLQSVQHNRLSHALLFAGPEGVGSLPLALAFAQYVVCTDRKDDGPCGECGACRRAAKFIHPDIHFSYPIFTPKGGDKPLCTQFLTSWRQFIAAQPYGNSYDWLQFIGAENRQGNIPVSECQDILHKMSLKSFEGGYKILIVWYPEFLGKEGNILLKLIEEPPPDTLFILVAADTAKILPTLISRTQLVRVGPLAATEVRDALIAREQAGETQAYQAASLSEGSYGEALRILEHAGDDLLETTRAWLNAVIQSRPVALQEWIEQMAGAKTGREKQKQFLRYFLNLLEHALRAHYTPGLLELPEREQRFAASLYKMADAGQIARIAEELDRACFQIERNANAKVLFHALSIRLHYIFTREPLPL